MLHFSAKMLYKTLPQGAAEGTVCFQTWAHTGAESAQHCLSTQMCTLASDRAFGHTVPRLGATYQNK